MDALPNKNKVAFFSVLAAISITGFKLVVGLLTGSLGILSEALHSGLDMVAAIITYFAIKFSDRPPDKNHPFGHGKMENLSAFIETILLLVTCVWIIYEALHRLMGEPVHIEVNFWSYAVVITSIVVDFWRSRALSRAAKAHNSQALEADALHFSTDIWSSAVVLIGLLFSQFGLFFADSVAALFVALIVIYVSYKLGKRAIDVLLDRAPIDYSETVELVLGQIPEILHYHDVKIRQAGADVFVELNIHVASTMTIAQAHEVAHSVEEQICSKIKRCTVHVHQEPDKEE